MLGGWTARVLAVMVKGRGAFVTSRVPKPAHGRYSFASDGTCDRVVLS